MEGTGEVFKLQDIQVRYGRYLALDIPSLKIYPSKIYAFVGHNGAGKTTLLHLLNLLLKPTKGRLYLWGQESQSRKFDQLRMRQRMTLVLQQPYLFSGTVRQNIEFGLRCRGISAMDRRRRVVEALREVGLEGFEERPVQRLSGGETKRVALARAFALDPEVLMLDEPTAHLDTESVLSIEASLLRWQKQTEKTIILTTHDLSMALKLAGQIHSLQGGKIGTPYYENIYKGVFVSEDNTSFFIHPNGLRIEVITERIGPGLITIDPREIILSSWSLHSSARNSLLSQITKIEQLGTHVKVAVHCCQTERNPVEFVAVITPRSYREMELKVGQKIYITFKAASVKVL